LVAATQASAAIAARHSNANDPNQVLLIANPRIPVAAAARGPLARWQNRSKFYAEGPVGLIAKAL
jgi:hypothetical protein